MNFRMTDLENFVEMALCRTQAEAAAKLKITPPSLSESMKRLESDLGYILFYRTRTGISLTSSGRNLLEKARVGIELLTEIGTSASGATSTQRRTVIIGSHPLVASYFLPQVLKELERSARGHFHIELRHDLSRNVQAEIQKGKVDIGIVVNPTRAPDLVIRELGRDEVAVWALKPKRKYERVIYDPDLFQAQAVLRSWKGVPGDWLSTSSLELAARLTQQGLGYGILPTRVVKLLGLSLHRVPSTPSHRDMICAVHRTEFGKVEFEKQCLAAINHSSF